MNHYSGNFDLNTCPTPVMFTGRIASSNSWQDNTEAAHFDPENQKGWGCRFRVRYTGLHSGNTEDLPDDQLPMANVIMPVTSGSGLGGGGDTTALTAGTLVWGFFMDGAAGQDPYIVGCLVNSNDDVTKKQPKDKLGGHQLFNDTYRGTNPQTGAFVPEHLQSIKKYEKPANISLERTKGVQPSDIAQALQDENQLIQAQTKVLQAEAKALEAEALYFQAVESAIKAGVDPSQIAGLEEGRTAADELGLI